MFYFLDEKYNKAPRQFSSASHFFLVLEQSNTSQWMKSVDGIWDRELLETVDAKQAEISFLDLSLVGILSASWTNGNFGWQGFQSSIHSRFVRPKSKLVGILSASSTKGKEQIKFPTSPATDLSSSTARVHEACLSRSKQLLITSCLDGFVFI